MHYLVTGGGGFIGTHLVRQLLADGHTATIMDDLSNSRGDNIPAEVTLLRQDVTQPAALDDIVTKVDGVFHLAAIVSVVKSTEEWLPTHKVTLGGMVALLDALVRTGRKIPVVYASSAAVYGDNTQTPFNETMRCLPISAYGADKLGCELHARVGALVHGIPIMGLRFFNVYGPGQNPASPYAGVISIFASRMHQGLPVTIYGDGEQTRDYIYISDIVHAMVLAMGKLEQRAVVQGIFNICTGVPVSVNQLVKTLAAITGSTSSILTAGARAGDIRISLGDAGFAQKALGFNSKTSLQDGLEFTLKTL